ncbi:MAG TPA: hypothetical protein VJH65_02115 [Candidatus Nanoarchaeia archaeon]|nr:hypothetical protein [Candidatus Nanoarchaeia archaeon]
MLNKRGQLTVFIIIAIVIVAAIIIYFAVKSSVIEVVRLPASLEPAYSSFLFCLEDNTRVGIDLIESQAGYIEPPEFEPGSNYMPFSNQLDFLGNPIPYWNYISGNGLEKEQVPTKENIEEELGKFIEARARDCDFGDFYNQGFYIEQSEPEADVQINDKEVIVNLKMAMNLEKAEDSAFVNEHKVVLNSDLGLLYNAAKQIYDKEQEELFLERYAVDNLRLYAPVDGVELTCSPQTWTAEEVFSGLRDAIEANTLALRTKGNDYSLASEENNYFVIDADVGANVRFISSKNWPYSFEVEPSEGNVLIAMPVGNQPGIGIIGFCYVPYHFVYDIKYPVLIQVESFDSGEVFQFPVALVLDNNNPRKSLEAEAVGNELPDLCSYKNTLTSVNVYDSHLIPVDADISYECFGVRCNIGDTVSGYGTLEANFPQCVNGYVVAEADGFKQSRELYSTTSEGSLDVILEKLYEIQVELKLDNSAYSGQAVISFISEDYSKTLVYPEQKSINLSEGQYEIQVYIYGSSSIKLNAIKEKKCINIPQSGPLGLFGFTKEKCYDIEIPSQTVENALTGGGKQNYYILESELSNSNNLEINTNSLPVPTNIEDLQNNYLLFENNNLEVIFR